MRRDSCRGVSCSARPPAEPDMMVSRSSGSAVNTACLFWQAFLVDSVMAGVAGYDGLATSMQHDVRPVGRLPSCVRESADVVELPVAVASADFSGVRQEPRDELFLRIVHPDWLTVGDLGRPLPLERDSAESRHQRFPVLPLDPCLETDSGPVGCVDSGLVHGSHLRHRRTVLGRGSSTLSPLETALVPRDTPRLRRFRRPPTNSPFRPLVRHPATSSPRSAR